MGRRWLTLVLLTALTLAGVGVMGLRNSYSGEEAVDVVVVLKATSPQMEFWQAVRQGIEAAAGEYVVEISVVGPLLEQQVDDQIAILRRVVEQNPDGIIIAASDYDRLTEPVEQAIEAGIPVVTVDSDVDSERVRAFVGTNNVEAGRRAGHAALERVPADATIAIVSHVPGVATAIEREAGVRAVLEDRPAGRTIGPAYAMNDEERARQIVEELVSDRVGVDAIVALNETSTVGVGRAIEDLGLAGSVVVVGFDASTEEISLLERGVVQALVVQKPFNMGYLSLRTIATLIRGGETEQLIDTGSEVVTVDNMYDEEIQQLMFPVVR